MGEAKPWPFADEHHRVAWIVRQARRVLAESETEKPLLFKAWQTLGTYYSNRAMTAKRRYEHDEARKFAPQYVACWREALPHASETDLALMGPYAWAKSA